MNKLDFFGGPINIYHNGKTKLTSSFGGLISLLILIMLGVLFYGFGQDFFLRKNPAFMKSTISPHSYPFHKLTNKNLSLVFRLEDVNGSAVNMSDQWYHQIVNKKYINDKKTKEFYISEEYPISLVKCNSSLLFLNNTFEKTYNLDTMLCPIFNKTLIGGFWDSDEIGYIEMNLYSCEEGNLNPLTQEKCGSNDLKNIYYNTDIYFTIYFQETVINPDNYISGIRKKMNNIYLLLDPLFLKHADLYIKEVLLTTDYGWLIHQIDIEKSFTISKIQYDMKSNNPNKSGNKMLIRNFIYLERESDNFKREYPKLQNVAAQVGGIIKIGILLAEFIVKSFNLNMFIISISNLLNKRFKNTKISKDLNLVNLDLESSKKLDNHLLDKLFLI